MKPIESLYNTLVQDGYDVGDLNTFSTKLQDSNKAKALYDAISTDGYDVGDFENFYSKLKPTVQFDNYSKQLGAAPVQPKVNTSMYVTPELEAQAQQQAVPQNVQPLSPEEAKNVIYGHVPGVGRTALGTEVVNTMGVDMAMKNKFGGYTDSSVDKTLIPEQNINSMQPKVKALTSTFDPEQIAAEEREQQKINAPAFSDDNLEHLWDVFNSASKSAFAAIGSAMTDQAKWMLEHDRYAKYDKESYNKAISNLDKAYQKTVEWGKSNQPKLAGTIGEDIMGMVPFASLAAASILIKNPTLARTTALGFGEMGWGEGLQAADEWGRQNGTPIDEWQRQSAAVGYMLAYTVPMGKYIDKFATKGIGKAILSKVLTANPEVMIKAGNEIIEQAAKQSPGLATKLIKTAMSSALHGVGTMEAIDLTKMVTDKLVLDKGVSVDEFWTRVGHSAKAGIMFGLATAPFATYASVKANQARRQAQGEVTFAVDENGKSVEIIPTKEGMPKGMTPDGKIVDVTQDMLKNSITMTTDHFNEAVKAYKENGSIEGEGFARNAFERRLTQSLQKVATSHGNIIVATEPDGTKSYLQGRNENGELIGINSNGEIVKISEQATTEKANISEVHASIMAKYDESNKYNPDVEQQQSIAAEKQAAADQLQSLASPDGMIRTVKMMDGTEMVIRGEKIVFDPETGRLDRKNSSEMLYYTDENGEVQVLNPKTVDSILSEKPIEQAAFEADQQIDQEISDKEIDEFLPLQPEMYQDAQGTVQVQYNPEAMEIEAVLIDEASGTPISEPYAIDKATYSQMSGKPMPEAIKTTENEPLNDGTQATSTDKTVETKDIEAKKADIERRRKEELSNRVIYDRNPTSKDGEFRIVGDSNRIKYRINEITGRLQQLDESNGLWSNSAGHGIILGSARASGFELLKENINAKYDAELAALETTPVQTNEVPVDEKGNMLFEQAAPEITVAKLSEFFEPDEVVATVKAKVTDIQKQIEKTGKFKATGNIQKDIQAKQAQKAQLEQLNSQLQYWNSVDALVTPKAPVEAPKEVNVFEEKVEIKRKPENKAGAAREKEWGEVKGLRDLVIRLFANRGQRVRWNDIKNNAGAILTRGLGAEYRYDNGEFRSHLGVIANDAPTPEQLAHAIWQENAYEDGQFVDFPLYGKDTQDILGEILDVLNSFTKGDMIKEGYRLNISQQEQAGIEQSTQESINNFESNFEEFINNPQENPFFVDETQFTPEQNEQREQLNAYFSSIGSEGPLRTRNIERGTDKQGEGYNRIGIPEANNEQAAAGTGADNGGIAPGNEGVDGGMSAEAVTTEPRTTEEVSSLIDELAFKSNNADKFIQNLQVGMFDLTSEEINPIIGLSTDNTPEQNISIAKKYYSEAKKRHAEKIKAQKQEADNLRAEQNVAAIEKLALEQIADMDKLIAASESKQNAEEVKPTEQYGDIDVVESKKAISEYTDKFNKLIDELVSEYPNINFKPTEQEINDNLDNDQYDRLFKLFNRIKNEIKDPTKEKLLDEAYRISATLRLWQSQLDVAEGKPSELKGKTDAEYDRLNFFDKAQQRKNILIESKPIKNGDTVTYKGKQYTVNGIYAGNKEVDLEDEKGNLMHEEVPVSELNQSGKTAEKEVEDFSKFVIGEYELKNTVKRSPTPDFEEYQNEAIGRYIHLIKPNETITGRELATRIAKAYDLYNIANRVDFSAIWYMGNKEVKHTLNGVSVKGKHKGNVSAPEIKPENQKEYTGVKAQIQKVLDNYDNSVNMTMNDVINDILSVAYDNDITEIQEAYKTYETELREDREQWGERGDREAIENNFMNVVEGYLNQSEQPLEKVPSGNKLPEQAERPSAEYGIDLFSHYNTNHGATNTVYYNDKTGKFIEVENTARGKETEITLEQAARLKFATEFRGATQRELNEKYTQIEKDKFEKQITDLSGIKNTAPEQSEAKPEVKNEIPVSEDGLYQIREVKVKKNDGSIVTMFAVPTANSKGLGDKFNDLFDTIEEAIQGAKENRAEQQRDEERDRQYEEEKRLAAEAKAAKAKANEGKTPAQIMQEAREKSIIDKWGKEVERRLADGYEFKVVDEVDKAAEKKREDHIAYLNKVAPWGNEKHPQTIELNQLKADVKAGKRLTKKSYRLDKNGVFIEVPKTVLDYYTSKTPEQTKPKEVTLFKKGEGGTKGLFQDKDGKLYKSLVRTYLAFENGKSVRKEDDKLSEEYEILKALQGNPRIPIIGEKVETSEGMAFEIEKLDEVESLTFDEYEQIRDILTDLNNQGYFVNDTVTVMKRPATGQLVIVDFSAGRYAPEQIGNITFSDLAFTSRLRGMMSKEDQQKSQDKRNKEDMELWDEIENKRKSKSESKPKETVKEEKQTSPELELVTVSTELAAAKAKYDKAQAKYLDLKKKLEKDPSFGMGGQTDIFGNVSGADNLFGNDGQKQAVEAVQAAKKAAEDLKPAVDELQAKADKLREAVTNKILKQQEMKFEEQAPQGEQIKDININSTDNEVVSYFTKYKGKRVSFGTEKALVTNVYFQPKINKNVMSEGVYMTLKIDGQEKPFDRKVSFYDKNSFKIIDEAPQSEQPLSVEEQEIVDTDSKIQNIVEQPKITATDEKIEDVGQKIGGAKKDLFQEYAKKLLSVTDQDIARLPLSKSFPRPNFAQLIEDGKMTQETAIFLNYFYDNIPSKPQKSYKVERWVKTVREALDTFNSVLESKPTRDLMQEYIDMLNTNIVGQRKAFNAEVYRAVRKAINFPNNDVNVGNLTILRSQTGENAYVYSVGNPIGNRVKLTGRFNTMEEAAAKLIEMAKETAGKPKQIEFSVYSSRSTGDIYITPKGKGEIVLQNGFKTSKEAFEYINENREALTDRFNAMKEIPSERRMSNKERVGFDYRQGKNVTAEDFGKEFGFRGVEFGNWVNQEERQAHINEAYDALMDLASVIGVTPRALSLNGELGFAFGSRGGGKYAAHYETDKVVINLTKTKGAGTLAHEWFHALDNYLLRAVGNRTSYATDGPGFNKEGKPALRPELNDAFRNLMKVIRNSGFYTRSAKLDKVKGSKYWGTSIELGARGFEDFVMNKLAKSNIQNDYLVNFKSLAEFIDRVNGDISEITSKYPYPTMEESETISEAYQNLFDTIQEDDNGVLFQIIAKKNKLVALHNISEDKLLNAEKIGGLPMPSIAITNIDNGFDSFGEITLIGNKRLIDPKNKENKIFAGDAYSPRYPNVTYNVKNSKAVEKFANKLPEQFARSAWHRIDQQIEDRGLKGLKDSGFVMYQFLKERGIDTTVERTSRYPKHIIEAISNIKGYDYLDIRNNEEAKKIVSDLYMEQNPIFSDISKRSDFLKLKMIDENGTIDSNILRDFFNSVKQESRIKDTIDESKTLSEARKYIEENGLKSEFNNYAENLYDSFNVEERIFKGYTPSGNRRYVPHTLDNVMKEMKSKKVAGGEGMFYGAGSARALVSPQFKSIEQIKAKQDLIVSSKDFKAVKEDINNELYTVSELVKPFYKYRDHVTESMSEELTTLARNGQSESFNKLSPEAQQAVGEFLEKLRNLPTEYFEAKITRPVYLSEFTAAIAPMDASPKTIEMLENAGLKVERYDNNRAEVLKRLAEENNAAFQIKPEAFDAARTASEKYEAAVEITKGLDEQNNTETIVARDNEEFISMLPEEYADFLRTEDVGGVFYKGNVIVNSEKQSTGTDILLVYEHEYAHKSSRRIHSTKELADLWKNATESDKLLLPEEYLDNPDWVKGDELISHAVEDIIEKQGYDNYKNGNIDLSSYSEILQDKLKKTIDHANQEYLRNIQSRNTGGSSLSNNNAGETIGNLREAGNGGQTPEFGRENERTSGQSERNVQGAVPGRSEGILQGAVPGRSEGILQGKILVDGVERPTTNSTGKPIHSTEEGIRNFWRWFGDSKVVDHEGRPRPLYHETNADWNIYDKSKIKAAKSDYITPNGIFLKSTSDKIGLGDKQVNLYANIKNPIYARDRESLENFFSYNIEEYADLANEINKTDKEYNQKLDDANKIRTDKFFEEREKFKGEIPSPEWSEIVEENSKESGRILEEWSNKIDELSLKAKDLLNSYIENSEYDGIFLLHDKGSWGRQTDATIALNPTQIKSATGNFGSFDPSNADIRFAKAWHGSPHAFNRFSLDKIGTGEGAQAYGWGLYFTDKKAIAEGYAKNLGNKNLSLEYKGSKVEQGTPLYMAFEILNEVKGRTIKQAIKRIEELKEYVDEDNVEMLKKWNDAIEFLRWSNKSDFKQVPSKNLYSVKIHGDKTIDELNFLRWDKPLLEQSKSVIESLEKQFSLNSFNEDYETAGDFYKNRAKIKGAENVSKELLALGIDGIQYPANYTTGKANETDFNYVVFDENAITIEDHIRFQILGEKGARNLDAAEEATTRLDNLRVAKEMEKGKIRKPLFEDEHGKQIVYDNGDFRIAVNDINNATYVTLWHKEEVKGKEYWARRGELYAGETNQNKGDNGEYKGKYLSIRSVEIEKEYRGLGLGKKLYKALEDYSGDDIKGIYSYLPNRVNKREVPTIYRRMNAKVVDGDHQFVNFNKKTFTPQEIRLATGWEKGVDGLWRYEVPDGKVNDNHYSDLIERKFNEDIKSGLINATTLGELYDSKELYSAYPELENMQVVLYEDDKGEGRASYNPDEKTIYIYNPLSLKSIEGRDNNLIHEIQHAVQHLENFAVGGNPDVAWEKSKEFIIDKVKNQKGWKAILAKEEYLWKPESLKALEVEKNQYLSDFAAKKLSEDGTTRGYKFDQYLKLSGETEARNASARMNFTADERRQRLLSETADVAPEDQIVLMDAVGVSESRPMPKPTPPTFTSRDTFLDRLQANKKYNEELKKWQSENIQEIAAQVGEANEVNAKLAELNKAVDATRAKLWEGWADSQKPVKKWQNYLKENGIDFLDTDDYYLRFTMVPSRVEYRFAEFQKNNIDTFVKTIKKFDNKGISYDDLATYAKLKHADEYTEHIAARKKVQVTPDTDFAGKKAIEDRIGMKADEYISEIEKLAGQDLIDTFWKQTKAINEFSLDEEVRAGIRSAESAREIKDTFQWYVPLKNHYDLTAEDAFDYSKERGTFFVSAVKKGKGRSSESGDPFSVMASTVRSTIGASEDNVLKQTLLRLAEKDNTGSTSVSKAWFVKVDEEVDEFGNKKPIFELAPEVPYTDTDTQETYTAKVAAHDAKMKQLAEAGEAYQGKVPKLKLGVWIKPTNVREHEVHVMRNGETYLIRFNTSPRIPQAVNKVNYRYYDGAIGRTFEEIGKVTRFMAAAKTMFRPTFIFITNPLRDIHAGLNLAFIDEGVAFAANVASYIPRAAYTLGRRMTGNIDLNDKYDKALNTYLLNGGKTGISKILELKQVERDLKDRMDKKIHPWDSFKKVYQSISEITENQVRLAVYFAAIDKGYSALKATSMAKEATINFDRKGNGRNGLKEVKSLYAFINVGFQALDNIYTKSTKDSASKKRFMASVAMNAFAGGILVSLISSAIASLFGADDDEWLEDFSKLSSFERNANFLVWTPNGVLKYPLGQEFRIYHALGMDFMMLAHGKTTATETAINMIKGLSSLVPYNPIEATAMGSWGSAMPDIVSPFTELATNRDWMGSRIYKENQSPEQAGYTKVRTNKRGEPYATETMMRLAKALDKGTGGDGAKKGWLSPNPDIVEHLLGGYLAGLYTQAMTTAEAGVKADPSEFIPSAIWKSGDDIKQRNSGLNEKYFEAKDEVKEMTRLIKVYNQQLERNENEYKANLINEATYNGTKQSLIEKIEYLQNDEYYKKNSIIKQIAQTEDELPGKPEKQQRQTETQISALKTSIVEQKPIQGYLGVKTQYDALLDKVNDYRKQKVITGKENPQLEEAYGRLYGSFGKMKSIHSYVSAIEKQIKDNNENVELTPEEKKQQNAELEAAATELMNQIIQQP